MKKILFFSMLLPCAVLAQKQTTSTIEPISEDGKVWISNESVDATNGPVQVYKSESQESERTEQERQAERIRKEELEAQEQNIPE